MKKLYIIKAGTTFENVLNTLGDFDKWVMDTISNEKLDICVIDIQNGQKLPPIDSCLGVIVTGAHAMVTDELPWSVEIENWIPKLLEKNIPYLGICYGHQLLAKTMNGISGYHPQGIEIGTTDITLNQNIKSDKIFYDLPSNFKVHTIHSQTVLTLPKNATLLASNIHDKHHAFRIGEYAWGVQFHPEYSCEIMSEYIKELLKEKNFSSNKIQKYLNSVQDTPYSAKVLKNFATFCLKK